MLQTSPQPSPWQGEGVNCSVHKLWKNRWKYVWILPKNVVYLQKEDVHYDGKQILHSRQDFPPDDSAP